MLRPRHLAGIHAVGLGGIVWWPSLLVLFWILIFGRCPIKYEGVYRHLEVSHLPQSPQESIYVREWGVLEDTKCCGAAKLLLRYLIDNLLYLYSLGTACRSLDILHL